MQNSKSEQSRNTPVGIVVPRKLLSESQPGHLSRDTFNTDGSLLPPENGRYSTCLVPQDQQAPACTRHTPCQRDVEAAKYALPATNNLQSEQSTVFQVFHAILRCLLARDAMSPSKPGSRSQSVLHA